MLSRQPSGRQVENVEEETEAAVAREMLRDRVSLPEVIDLTEHKVDDEDAGDAAAAAAAGDATADQPESAASSSGDAHDALPPLQLRLAGSRASIQPSAGNFRFILAKSRHSAQDQSHFLQSNPIQSYVSLNNLYSTTPFIFLLLLLLFLLLLLLLLLLINYLFPSLHPRDEMLCIIHRIESFNSGGEAAENKIIIIKNKKLA